MVEELFRLLDDLLEKEKAIEAVIKVFGGDGNWGFLTDQIHYLEKMIVRAYGGNEDHYKHISSTELFWEYQDKQIPRSELVDYIELTIEKM